MLCVKTEGDVLHFNYLTLIAFLSLGIFSAADSAHLHETEEQIKNWLMATGQLLLLIQLAPTQVTKNKESC